ADRLRHFPRLAESHADVTVAIPDHDQRRKGKSPAALDDLGDPVDRHDAVREVQCTRIDTRLSQSTPPLSRARRPNLGSRATHFIQTWSPAPRAASASAFTRP